MKNKFTRILSSILILAMLLSVFAMTVLASDSTGGEGETDDETEEEEGGITVLYNRDYEEGWNYGNGLTCIPRSQRFSIEYEEDENFNYNYFFRLEGLTNTDHGYFDIMYGGNSPSEGYSILEFDIKTDDAIEYDFTAFSMRHTSSGKFTQLAKFQHQQLSVIGQGGTKYNASSSNVGDASGSSAVYSLGDLTNKWIHIAYVFNFDHRVCPDCHKPFNTAGVEDAETVICTEHGKKMEEMAEAITITVYYGYAASFNPDKAVYNIDQGGTKDLTKTYKYDTMYVMPDGGSAQIHSVRVERANKIATFCLDNLRVYNGSPVPIKDLDPETYGYGSLVVTSAEKEIEILQGAGAKSDLEYVTSGLAMKLGVNNALYAGQKKPILKDNDGNIYGAPVKIDGRVYVPLQAIIDYIGFPVYAHADGISYDISTSNGSAFIAIGRDSATVNGEIRQLVEAPNYVRDKVTNNTYLVIALEDVDTIFDGYHATYDEMGLVVVTEAKYDNDGNVIDAVDRATGLNTMLSLMKEFVVEYKGADDYYTLVKNNTNFAHPYLLADQDKFDSLKDAYGKKEGDDGYDATLKAYLDEFIRGAKEVYEIYASEESGKYDSIKDSINVGNPYEGSNGGYSSNGSLTEVADHAEAIRTLALAYQITRDYKYSDLAYDLAVALASWKHWGPAHIVDLANAATPYALAYDWLYNVWTADEDKDIAVIEKAIYEKVLYEGYNASNGVTTQFVSVKNDIKSDYTTMTDYWNATTTEAMVISSLALLGATGDDDLYTNISVYSKWLIENNIKTLVKNGLDAYAPDGAFFSGPEHWQKTTDAFFTTIWALIDATGSDMGLLDVWGVYDTFYYAMYIEYFSVDGEVAGAIEKFNSGYSYWNYHDSIAGTLDTSMFFFATRVFGDNTFAAYRVMQLEIKELGYLDLLAYDKAYTELDSSDFELPLDYVLEGCDAYISRDSYEKGSLYVGLMGNTNGVGLGQIDAGNFIYVNKGYNWFVDAGGENPAAYGYLDDPSTRYRYYRASAEGANVVCVTTSQSTIPYGQLQGVSPYVEEYVVEEGGSYVIMNTKALYGDLLLDGDAKRGMLLTNNRSTVVIQDEIKFDQVQTVYWLGHTAANIQLSADGRTAYLTKYVNGELCVLRATLVSRMSFEFSVISAADDYLLGKTMKPGESQNSGGAAEYKRNDLQRLVIESREQMSFECAVVLEMVEKVGESDKEPVGYEWTYMNDWEIGAEFEATPEDQRNALITDISTYAAIAGNYLARDNAFGDKIVEFYAALAMVASAEETYRPNQIMAVKEIYSDYLDFCMYREQYRAFMREINKTVSAQNVLAQGLIGQ